MKGINFKATLEMTFKTICALDDDEA